MGLLLRVLPLRHRLPPSSLSPAPPACHCLTPPAVLPGTHIPAPAGLLQALVKATGEDALPLEREAGLHAYAALAREAGRPVEPFLLPMLPQVLACHADKVRCKQP
jgi:hypothetical protein